MTIIISGCWSSSKTDYTLLKELEEGITNSNEILSLNNDDVYHYLETTSQDNPKGSKAAIWQPKALLVKKFSSDIILFIDSLKTGLKKAEDIKSKNETDIINRFF